MLRSRILPCLLIRNKGLVKTVQFKDGKYVGDPINAVKIFNEKEVDELTIFDLDATKNKVEPDYERLRQIAVESRMPLCYGGGVTTAAQASKLISLGYEKVSVSAAAIDRPDLIAEMADAVGRQSVVVTLDVKAKLFGAYAVMTHNGQRKTKIKLEDFIPLATEKGAGEIVINSIDHDGMMDGYDLKLASWVRGLTPVPMTMVGGAGSTDDMAALISEIGTCGAGAGSLFVFKGPYKAVLINYARP